ncbi:MAG: Rne/Rng family ribonuclease [Actinomycetota bacterium]
MLKLFRRKLRQDAPSDSPAPQPAPPAVTRPPAEAGAQPASTRPRRRRGSRGGRNRRKPAGSGTGTATTEAPAKDDKPAAEKKPERKPAQRQRSGRPQQQRRRQQERRPPLPKAQRQLLVSVDVGEQRVAVLEDGRPAEVYLERPERRSIAGNIYKGTVDNVLPGMEAAFVEIGLEKNGFLYVDEIVGPELEGKRHGRKIQDLIKRGQEILVQSVKDPMKSKGARLTTEISLPGRFVVFVPHGEGLGVSRRLEDDERIRLRDIVKGIAPKKGGVIVRTAAEGASAEDVERDLVFLQRLWKSIEANADKAKAPALVYQEAELPLRVTRDLFTGDFEKALIDDEKTYKRIVGYLKKTSPHMVDRVIRHREKTPLFEQTGVEDAIRSTLSRRVDLPSGGYLVFDYAEAFTVIDVNTGRFVGSRSKSSAGRLEDTITANNLEAVKEVVHQLRLRDIGGIIVIDFIDMANPKNRATVEGALKTELERDRTKTYVVEISPLGLVEMTRQNVTDGPREILTQRCPTCAGDGIVLSTHSAAIDMERKLRDYAKNAKRGVEAFRIELEENVASHLIGAGAQRLIEIEAVAKRRFFLEGKAGAPLDHFKVLGEGKLVDLAPKASVEEGAEIRLDLVEVGKHDLSAAMGKLDGLDVCVADAAKLVGKKVKVRVERVLDGMAHGTLVQTAAEKRVEAPITAESEAEKPTRAVRKKVTGETAVIPAPEADKDEEPVAKAVAEAAVEPVDAVADEVEEPPTEEPPADGPDAAAAPPKKKTRRGSRGGRNRRKPAAAVAAENGTPEETPVAAENGRPAEPEPKPEPVKTGATIHVPSAELGQDGENATAAEGEQPPRKKRTRRGSRGGRNRRKKPAAGASPSSDAPAASSDSS